MRMAWLPHVMYLQEPHFRSEVVNTDSHGFRVSTDHSGKPVDFERIRGTSCNLLIGNSTAFGVGATNDGATLASVLARETGETWFNFSGRSYSSTQELLLFQAYFDEIKNVRRIVIFSGANNLVLHHRSPLYPRRFGSFFFWRQFEQSMLDAALSPNRRRLKALLFPIFGDKFDYEGLPLARLLPALLGFYRGRGRSNPEWPAGRSPRDRDEVLSWMERDLRLWRILAKSIDAELIYVLQPLGGWVRKKPSVEEAALWDQVGRSPLRFNRVLAHDLDSAIYQWFAPALSEACRRVGLEYLDMNEGLSRSGLDGRWIFNDYIHLTDEGYRIAGKMIADRIASQGSVGYLAANAPQGGVQ